jgi:class 3 adenylate cyclase
MAIRMRERVQELQAVWHEHGISRPLRVRMGISTGYCTVGNFGSEHRIEYTVLGSPVNLAARLQAKAEADTILISEATYLLISDATDCARMEDVHLKGFVRPIGSYRLNALTGREERNRQVTRIGQHVAVSIPDRRRIREAITELHRIGEELAQFIPEGQ